ncbi:hypothetical protein [Roseateles sp.]|uniref:hypothetical protein n=1 Tax=Roseateles sp. TaxID=1971397 RepID=UPI002F416CA2
MDIGSAPFGRPSGRSAPFVLLSVPFPLPFPEALPSVFATGARVAGAAFDDLGLALRRGDGLDAAGVGNAVSWTGEAEDEVKDETKDEAMEPGSSAI